MMQRLVTKWQQHTCSFKGRGQNRIRTKIWQGTYSWRDRTNELIDIKTKLLCVPLQQGIYIQHVSHESTFVKASKNTQKILLSCIIPVISTGIVPVNSLSYSRIEANVRHSITWMMHRKKRENRSRLKIKTAP
jgi:hypothetical protein